MELGGTITNESVITAWLQTPGPLDPGTTRNVTMSILSGLTSENQFLWPNAAPIEFTFELYDKDANLAMPYTTTNSNE